MQKIHMASHLERQCKCGATLSIRIHDYGLLTYPEFDAQLGQQDFPVVPLKCPGCDIEGWPEHLTMYNLTDGKMEPAVRTRIGTDGFPVVGGEALPYAVTLTAEEQAEYDRGLEKKDDCYQEHEKEFWSTYCDHALAKWPQSLRELTTKEFVAVYQALEMPMLPGHASTAVWRKDAEKRIAGDTRRLFWRLSNRYLVEEEFIWTPIDTWPMEEWVREYGRDRVTYLTLHVPLPEELERWRTKALGKVVKKRSGESGVLFERIGQLGRDLDRQRNRSAELSRQLSDARQENAVLAEQVGRLRREIGELKSRPAVVARDMEDVRKIRALKGLVAELRGEVERLAGLLPAAAEAPEALPEPAAPSREEVDLSVLAGKTVLVAGWPREIIEREGCRMVWHHGDSVDVDLQALARQADVYVVLTRCCSHAAMWWLKEAAIDRDVPVVFARETNVERILEIVAGKIKARG
ncbi:MAG: DUF2325 domain-containing protein [Bacillota bacterium]